MKQGDSSVREYNASFAAAGLTNNPDQGMLVKMYRDGLKEDIRVALGSTEFSTIEDIMQAAIEIEEGPRSSSSDSSNESDGSDSSNESDESEKCQKKKPQTEFERKMSNQTKILMVIKMRLTMARGLLQIRLMSVSRSQTVL